MCKVSPCNETAKCTSSQLCTQQTKHLLTLIVIQVYALPGLSHVIALTGNGLNCWVEDRHKHEPTVQKRSWNLYSRTKDICLWSLIALTTEINIVCISFFSHWLHMNYSPQHPDKSTYLLHGAESFLRSYLVLQLIKKFPAFYGTLKFITVLSSSRHLFLSWANSLQSPLPPSHFLKIHLNIILPSTSWSPQWSLSIRFPHQKPCAHLSLPPYVPHAPPISFFSILSPAQYWVRSTDH